MNCPMTGNVVSIQSVSSASEDFLPSLPICFLTHLVSIQSVSSASEDIATLVRMDSRKRVSIQLVSSASEDKAYIEWRLAND